MSDVVFLNCFFEVVPRVCDVWLFPNYMGGVFYELMLVMSIDGVCVTVWSMSFNGEDWHNRMTDMALDYFEDDGMQLVCRI